MFVVSGQVKWETTVRSTKVPLRQLGDQEIDIERSLLRRQVVSPKFVLESVI
jgi:hypothetical protein